LMKKPALVEITVRLFPDKDFDAATTQTTTKGHVTGRFLYSPPKSRNNIASRIFKRRSTSSTFTTETLGNARDTWQECANQNGMFTIIRNYVIDT
jgi:hypothetical protein